MSEKHPLSNIQLFNLSSIMQNMTNQHYRQLEKVVAYIDDCKTRRLPFSIVAAYWHVGRLVNVALSESLATDFLEQLVAALQSYQAANLSRYRIRQCMRFYLAFPDWAEVYPELSWTHYTMLLRLPEAEQRNYYAKIAAKHHWTSAQLRRQIASKQYERTHARSNYLPLIKDNYILEFTELPSPLNFSERTLELALIDKLQDFLLELGNGFSFVARQKLITTETGKRLFIDLVFYHIELNCFVLIDLKITPLNHHDVGQMDMYVRLFEDRYRRKDDQPTIGIVLCPTIDPTIVKYSVIADQKQVFASTYQLSTPLENDLPPNLLQQMTAQLQSVSK